MNDVSVVVKAKNCLLGLDVECGGPLQVAFFIPAGVTSDGQGRANGFSNILCVFSNS